MLPILKALRERLLHEPAFFLAALAAGAVVVQQQVDLPGWVAPGAVVLFGLATRAVVTPAARDEGGFVSLQTVALILVIIAALLFIAAHVDIDVADAKKPKPLTQEQIKWNASQEGLPPTTDTGTREPVYLPKCCP